MGPAGTHDAGDGREHLRQTAASVQTVGVGSGEYGPELVSSRPVLGGTFAAFAWHCQPGADAYFGFSAVPYEGPTDLGSGFVVQVDLDAHMLFGPLQTDAFGNLTYGVWVNLPASYIGQQVMLQLQVANPSWGAYGFELTNELLLTFGDQ